MRRLRELLELLGPIGVIGLGILLFCVPFYLTALAPAEREVEALQAAAERVRTRTLVQPVAAAGDRTLELQRFHALFPPLERVPDELERLFRLAREARLELEQGEYRMEARGAGLVAYRATLPVRGAYAQVRKFVAALLGQFPIASLDGLRFERKRIGDAELEAQLRLTLYFQPRASAAGSPNRGAQ
jgi:hypothetical protein